MAGGRTNDLVNDSVKNRRRQTMIGRERERERDSDVYYMDGDDVLRYLFSLGIVSLLLIMNDEQ